MGTAVGKAMVQNGSATSVPLFTEAPVFANLPVGQGAGASLTLRYRGPIEAPIRRGRWAFSDSRAFLYSVS